MGSLDESYRLSEASAAPSLHEEDCCDDWTAAPPQTAVEIERHLSSCEPSLQTRDHRENLLRGVVSIGQGKVPPAAIVAFVGDVHNEADSRGTKRLCLPCRPHKEHTVHDLTEWRSL